MKKFILALMAMLTMALSASAMSYEQARDQALFLTDKMAYELNLTEEQYEAAYEVNLDYLMRVNTVDDLYGIYWTRRNLDLSYIMLDWQYQQFYAANYFYRPLWWGGGYWHFSVYSRYPHRTYFYFGCPQFVTVYRGGHSWYGNGGHSWYEGRNFRGPERNGRYEGMRDGFQRGDYRQGFGNGRRLDVSPVNSRGTIQTTSTRNTRGNSTVNGFGRGSRASIASSPVMQEQNRITRSSSTRETVRNTYGGGRLNNSSFGTTPSRSFTPSSSSSRLSRSGEMPSQNRFSTSSTTSSRSFGSPSGSFSSPSRSFSGSSSMGGRSFGGGSSSGMNRSSGGGHSFGHR